MIQPEELGLVKVLRVENLLFRRWWLSHRGELGRRYSAPREERESGSSHQLHCLVHFEQRDRRQSRSPADFLPLRYAYMTTETAAELAEPRRLQPTCLLDATNLLVCLVFGGLVALILYVLLTNL